MSYEPQPGTVAYRAIAWLRKQPAGTELTASMWAEAIGNTDGSAVSMSIRPAILHGLVKERTRNGLPRPKWFSLGDGTKPEPPEPVDDEEPMRGDSVLVPVQRIVPAATAAPMVPASVARPVFPHPAAASEPEPEPEPAPQLTAREYIASIGRDAPAQAPESPPLQFNACRYIDGSLVVVGAEIREDGAIVFTPKQAAALWRLREAA